MNFGHFFPLKVKEGGRLVSYCKQQQTKKNVYWAFCAELYSTDRNAFAAAEGKADEKRTCRGK